MYKSGVDAARGFLKGMQSLYKTIVKNSGNLGKSMVKALKKALGIKSPSRVFKKIGAQTVEGLSIGLDDRVLKTKAIRLSDALTRNFNAELEAGFRASATKGNTTNYYTVEVKVDNNMTDEQIGVAISKKISKAQKAGLIRA